MIAVVMRSGAYVKDAAQQLRSSRSPVWQSWQSCHEYQSFGLCVAMHACIHTMPISNYVQPAWRAAQTLIDKTPSSLCRHLLRHACSSRQCMFHVPWVITSWQSLSCWLPQETRVASGWHGPLEFSFQLSSSSCKVRGLPASQCQACSMPVQQECNLRAGCSKRGWCYASLQLHLCAWPSPAALWLLLHLLLLSLCPCVIRCTSHAHTLTAGGKVNPSRTIAAGIALPWQGLRAALSHSCTFAARLPSAGTHTGSTRWARLRCCLAGRAARGPT